MIAKCSKGIKAEINYVESIEKMKKKMNKLNIYDGMIVFIFLRIEMTSFLGTILHCISCWTTFQCTPIPTKLYSTDDPRYLLFSGP